MSAPATFSRQNAIGGAIGVTLLLFALVYHFFPQALRVAPEQRIAAPVQPQAGTQGPVAPRAALTPAESELQAGPPISLAPTSVIASRARGHALAGGGDAETGALLKRADAAAAQGRLAGEGDDTAAALVLQAAAIDPEDAHVRAALSNLHARLFADAQQALAANDTDTARVDLSALKQFPDAAADAHSLAVRIQAADRVRPLLERGVALIQAGRLEGAGEDNALSVYRQVLTLDPENAVARQGLERVQRGALDRALTAAAQNKDAEADAALSDAAASLRSSPQLADTRARIRAMRDQRGAGLLTQAQSALDAGNLDLAQTLTQQAQAIDDTPSGQALLKHIQDARTYASYRPGQVFSDRFLDIVGSAPSVVVVPLGAFQMGAAPGERGSTSSEEPRHEVDITRGFAIGRTEVTVAQFRAFVRASGYVPDSDRLGGASVYDEGSGRMQTVANADWRDDYAGARARDNDPVVNVSWNDANAYARWLSERTGKRYRLPSEAEFEYAERAGTTTPYWWGSGTPAGKVENLTGGSDRSPSHRSWSNAFNGYDDGWWGPAPVMSFAPNPFGLYDIAGNVSEWVEDCWHDNYTRAPRDGSAWVNPGCAQRVIRGGSWGSAPDQDRSAYRQAAPADTRSGRVGFRIVRDL
ncbi:MAG: formylglycine-generating enzyme family protein [Proteobacteria bacterium]|nr:formylglycine-generating enzyme family protein [Pseudomonadota bacterium]